MSTVIKHTDGDIFTSKAEVLVNPVNIVGVMGKGLALAFKEKYPDMYLDYMEACKLGVLRIGTVVAHEVDDRVILSFPTKRHWRAPSRYQYVRHSLYALREYIVNHKVSSVAIPAVGCGLGGLDWTCVEGMILDILGDLPVSLELFAP